LIALTQYFFTVGRNTKALFIWRDGLVYELFLLSLTGMSAAFLFIDFVNDGSSAWIKSRFLEGPVYMVLFCAFYAIHRAAPVAVKRAAVVLIAIYIIVPFIANERPRQIQANAKAFARALSLKR
jgi:hypothetical protein